MTSLREQRPPIATAVRRSRAPEPELALRGTVVAVLAAVPVVALAGALRGGPGLAGALLAAGLVIGLFATTLVVLACVVRWRPAILPAASLVVAVVRMVAYGVLLASLADADDIDRLTTVVTACVLLAVTLVYEVRYVSTRPGFYWVAPPAPDGAQTKERTRG